MLSIAEEPGDVFAISLVDARARARAVIHHELAAGGSDETANEAPGTGGILEREASIAAGADDGNTRLFRKP